MVKKYQYYGEEFGVGSTNFSASAVISPNDSILLKRILIQGQVQRATGLFDTCDSGIGIYQSAMNFPIYQRPSNLILTFPSVENFSLQFFFPKERLDWIACDITLLGGVEYTIESFCFYSPLLAGDNASLYATFEYEEL